MRSILRFLCVVFAVAGLTFHCSRVDAVDKPAEEKEAESLLVRYLRIDTANPPGNESAGAIFLRDVLEKEGIETRLLGRDPKRQSLYAIMHSGNTEPALVLMHHIDVVPADVSEWSVPPFGGERAGGYLWGRGALDIKSLGIAELTAMLELKRSKAKLSRDIIYLAVADEEAGGAKGAGEILETYPELFRNVAVVLNEGGSNETIVDQISVYGIEVAQKIPLWIRLRSTGAAGHGSAPGDDPSSIARLLGVLQGVATLEFPYRVVPEVDRYFEQLAAVKPGRKGELLRGLPESVTASDFSSVISPGYRSLLRNTVAITSIRAGESANSIPASATATLDVRLLPGESSAPVIKRIEELAGERAKVEVLLDGGASPSAPIDHFAYRAIAQAMKKQTPKAVVVPLVSSGTSDSRFFRRKGIVAFGISPFKVNYYDADTVHGVDERIRIRFFAEGVRLTRDIVRSLAVAPAK